MSFNSASLRVYSLFRCVLLYGWHAACTFAFSILSGLYGVVAVLSVSVNVVVVSAVLFFPVVIFISKIKLDTVDIATLFRREFVTLVALDVAITQHFFLIAGYSGGVLTLSTVLSLFSNVGPLAYLLSWVTLSAPGGDGTADIAKIFAVTVAVYGTVGIALVASLVITTYTRVLHEFSVSDDELVRYLFLTDTDPSRYTRPLSPGDFPTRATRRAARDKVWEEFRQIVAEKRFGDPVLGLLWGALRFYL